MRVSGCRARLLTGALGAALIAVSAAHAGLPPAAVRQCLDLRHHGQETAAQKCFMGLTRNESPYLRAEGDWGVADYDSANKEFRAAVAQADGNALVSNALG